MSKRLLVVEFITGGGLSLAPLPEALQHEGDAMLAALLADLDSLNDWRVLTTRDVRLAPLACNVQSVAVNGNAELMWQRCMAEVDAVWWIAPETGGELQRLNEWTLRLGLPLIGCKPSAVALTTNKLALATALSAAKLPTIATQVLGGTPPPSALGWIIKPIDGAGCQQTWWCRDLHEFESLSRYLQGKEASFIMQAYCIGEPASLSLLCANGRARVLACNRQKIEVVEGRLCYLGSEVNAYPELCKVYTPLAEQLAAAIPGLWGYVGVDLILTEHGPLIVEINPRLTTSYVGLSRAIASNAAKQILALPNADWWPGSPLQTAATRVNA